MNIFSFVNNVYFCFIDSGTDGESQSGSKEQLSERKMPKPPAIATITYKVMDFDFKIYLVLDLYSI